MGTHIVEQSGQLEISYDREADVLYRSLGQPKPAVTDEDREGVLIRRDGATDEIVGITILDYEKHFRDLKDVSWLADEAIPPALIDFLQRRPPSANL